MTEHDWLVPFVRITLGLVALLRLPVASEGGVRNRDQLMSTVARRASDALTTQRNLDVSHGPRPAVPSRRNSREVRPGFGRLYASLSQSFSAPKVGGSLKGKLRSDQF